MQVSSLVDVFKPFLSRLDCPAHFLRSAPFHAVTVKSQIHCFLILTCLFLPHKNLCQTRICEAKGNAKIQLWQEAGRLNLLLS